MSHYKETSNFRSSSFVRPQTSSKVGCTKSCSKDFPFFLSHADDDGVQKRTAARTPAPKTPVPKTPAMKEVELEKKMKVFADFSLHALFFLIQRGEILLRETKLTSIAGTSSSIDTSYISRCRSRGANVLCIENKMT